MLSRQQLNSLIVVTILTFVALSFKQFNNRDRIVSNVTSELNCSQMFPSKVDAGTCYSIQITAHISPTQLYCLPSFVIIGAMKSGTGELMRQLNTRSGFSSGRSRDGKKEVHFFGSELYDRSMCRELDYVLSFPVKSTLTVFASNTAQSTSTSSLISVQSESFSSVMTFDKSPNLLRDTRLLRQLHDLLPNVKLVALLREPAGRAVSEFRHHCLRGRYRRLLQDVWVSLTWDGRESSSGGDQHNDDSASDKGRDENGVNNASGKLSAVGGGVVVGEEPFPSWLTAARGRVVTGEYQPFSHNANISVSFEKLDKHQSNSNATRAHFIDAMHSSLQLVYIPKGAILPVTVWRHHRVMCAEPSNWSPMDLHLHLCSSLQSPEYQPISRSSADCAPSPDTLWDYYFGPHNTRLSTYTPNPRSHAPITTPVRNLWAYAEYLHGVYAAQLQAALGIFPTSQLLVLSQAHLRRCPRHVIRQVEVFLRNTSAMDTECIASSSTSAPAKSTPKSNTHDTAHYHTSRSGTQEDQSNLAPVQGFLQTLRVLYHPHEKALLLLLKRSHNQASSYGAINSLPHRSDHFYMF